MSKGSIPRPVAVPPPSYAPDGLTEADVDALIAEVDADVRHVRSRPGWLSTDQIEIRRARHMARQAMRALRTANLLVSGVSDQRTTFTPQDGEAA